MSDADAESILERATSLLEGAQIEQARVVLSDLLSLRPDLPMAHNNLGWTQELLDDAERAIGCYCAALNLNSQFELARANLASVLYKQGRYDASYAEWMKLLDRDGDDQDLLTKVIDSALRAGRVATAAKHAQRFAALQRSSIYCRPLVSVAEVPRPIAPPPQISAGSLEHDIDQFEYLRGKGILGEGFDSIIAEYKELLGRGEISSRNQRLAMSDALDATIGSTYGRFVNLRDTPSLTEPALCADWSPRETQDTYLRHRFGLVVIDDFLSTRALEELRAFCLESTVWFANKYGHDRLGAFFRLGFSCPLLVQIANELSAALPDVLGGHPLLQLWGFKYSSSQPATAAHADFAAVNVNFWITPDSANLNDGGGGLLVYDVEAPADWNFDDYNKNGKKIRAFLAETGARAIHIPYRANRAVIFNSDLFHATAPFAFAEGYENRRINVTLLYGNRG